MDQYLDATDSLGQKINSQNRAKPKRRSVFYQQSSSLYDNNNEEQKEENQSSSDNNNEEILKLKIFQDDGYLKDHASHFQYRNKSYNDLLDKIEEKEGGLLQFARTYKQRGVYQDSDNNIVYQEWAPGAKEVYLTGDFCNWDRKKYPLQRDEFGNWKIVLKDTKIPHGSKIKTHILNAEDKWVDKIPVYTRYAIQNGNTHFDGIFWNPEKKHQFKNQRPKRCQNPKIYECHIGMSGEIKDDTQVFSFNYFTKNVLPRVNKLGYNVIQIMAIAEHAYYGSFGYHVTLPFAISSRFGTPEDFKQLVDAAHGYGIQVLIDIVHSHASSNTDDGINAWDGTDNMYFHGGEKGQQKQWDSRLYNYSNWETLRLLLSNIAYFLEEYYVDGFRFDGVTSMLYTHHGIGTGFTGNYQEYFNMSSDIDSLVYLMLANKLISLINPQAITIAEDVSGYPTLCRSHVDGGVGFHYRLQMAIPDKWIKLLKEQKDEDWNIGDIVHTLTNRRHLEPCIAYAESHDQALVGDKTLAMWLFDKEIYFNMSRLSQETPVIKRGIALHKMIRLITFALGGEGYLNFMGNEFGHPEWIDFPREGNGWSHAHCQRKWSLCDDKLLRYPYLYNFDRKMLKLENKLNIIARKSTYVSEKHEGDKLIAFEKDELVFVFNFHPSKDFNNYKVGTNTKSDYIVILDSETKEFGGYKDSRRKQPYPIYEHPYNNRNYSIDIDISSRSVLVLAPVPQKKEEIIFDDDDDDEEEN